MQTTPSGGRSSTSVTEHLKHNRKAVIGFGVGFGCLLRALLLRKFPDFDKQTTL